MNFLYCAVAALFLGQSLLCLIDLRWARRLPPLAPGSKRDPAAPFRQCSVVLPARNEKDRIEKKIRTLLDQVGVTVELIVVDDRSTDGTAEILARLAREDSRIHAMRVDALPDGWLGKCHACHLGAKAATRDWLLFTDADCWLKPDVIVRALHSAELHAADHITLSPGFEPSAALVRAWHLNFLISALSWISRVNRDRPKAYLGAGAFNLMRASAYRACGGYEALRMTVVDDVKLGLLLRRAGKRTRAFLGADDVECHWGTTLGDIVRVMEKNFFAIIDYRTGLGVLMALLSLMVVGVFLLGLFAGSALGLLAALSPCSLMVPGALVARRIGWPWHDALAVPLTFPIFLYAFFNSMFVTLRQRGIRWRNTFYPLA
ncbi:MAG TPA: glycosyltransferase family 2 protein, partial [Chthoniobacteraceae bacterium]|nr:glycosyltransferase family 2 protein [Chthoniobacteraceae bacterium]